MSEVKVIYIAGTGRNGSTLLSYILGEIPGFVNVGEAARYLYTKRMRERNLPCGCGEIIDRCSFWRELLPLISGEAIDIGTKLGRISLLPILLLSIPPIRAKINQLGEELGSLYKRIREERQAEFIVDSSKHPATAYILSQVSAIDLHVAHLVRDPEGVVQSWRTKKDWLKAQRSLSAILFQVYAYNVLPEILFQKSRKYLRIYYEDLVRSPQIVLKDLLAWLGIESASLPFIEERQVFLQPQHALGGNPDKLSLGIVELKTRTLQFQPRSRISSLLLFPLRAHYRYL